MKVVLVVDDETLLTMVASSALEEAGFAVLEAYDGQNALELLSGSPVDVIVTDYMMPRRNGLELAAALKSDPSLSCIPVVLTSAVPGDVVQRHPGMFAAFLQKPYDLDQLVSIVAELAGSHL